MTEAEVPEGDQPASRETFISRGARVSVGTVAPAVRRMVRILRFPAYAVGCVALPALIGMAIISVTATGWDRVTGLAVAAAGFAVVASWWIRIYRYVYAVADPGELTEQFVRLADLLEMRDEVVGRFRSLAERGGWRFFGRLRSLWKVVSIPDYLTGRIEELDRARWFVPPCVGTTVLRATLLLWTTIVAWLLFAYLFVLRLISSI